MDTGYIKIHRKITDWEWYHDLPVFRLFTHLLFAANWKDKRWKGVEVKRGQLISSISNLSKSTGLTPKQVRGAMQKLKSTGELASQTTNRFTLYTIVKYNTYQDDSREEGKPEGSQGANEGQAEGKQRATTKELKKERTKEVRSRKAPKRFIPPEFFEFEEYCIANNFGHIAQKAFDYYTAGGWKDGRGAQVKNWKQKLRGVWFDEAKNPNPKQQLSRGRQFETAQERRKREIKEQKERMLKELGGGHSDKAADDHGEFISPVRVF